MISRLGIYLKEMFPPTYAIMTLLYVLVVLMTFHKGLSLPLTYRPEFLVVGLLMLFLVLTIRVMDEIKDYPDDLKNYPDRPLPSGKVTHKDLYTLMTALIIVSSAISFFDQALALAHLACLGLSFLMYKWFFMEKRMRKSLPLAFITHHPIVWLYLLLIFSSMLVSNKVEDMSVLWIIIPIGLLSTNWEISRKIRAPQKETAYTTYSKIWGARAAISVSLGLIAIFSALFTYFYLESDVPFAFIIGYVALSLLCAGPYFLFLLNPNRETNFKQQAEVFSTLNTLALGVSFFLS